MSTTIRIDDEVYEALKERAEPFVDSPNSVLRRLLGLSEHDESTAGPSTSAPDSEVGVPHGTTRRKRKRTTRKRTRAAKGTLLSEEEYELPLLQILASRGGSAPTRDVLQELERILDERLTAADRERLSSGGVRWRQRAQFVRLRLVEAGDMVADSPRGIWQISEQGLARVREGGGV
jgi:predicted CopG family antitoxin